VNYYRGTHEHPYHLSVGAVLINDHGEVCCHYFTLHQDYTDFYLLMRETMEAGETIEQALHRGLREEFAATAQVVGFLGSIVSEFDSASRQTKIQKTTLYFQCQLNHQDLSRREPDDPEAHSQIQWHPPQFLIPKMEEQFQRLGRADMNEAAVLNRLSV
jgi:ADP-ribose pyrophosphatase YjhB (NUDIX family)